jgi:hypothetical protein
MSYPHKPNHSPEHMARMARAAGQSRTFSAEEQAYLRTHWETPRSIAAMAAELRCRIPVLKREAKLLGLPSRCVGRKPIKASALRVKRTYNKGCERVKDVDGEKSSPPPEGIMYACPGCGHRALEAIGHTQCLAKVA